MNDTILRPAKRADAALLDKWQQAAHVKAALPDLDWNWPEQLTDIPEWIEYFIAEHAGKPVGFLEILDPKKETWNYWNVEEDHLRAIDIWIGEEQWLGRGIGSLMMKQALEKCFAHREVKAIILDVLETNQRVIPFYQRLGFRHTHTAILAGHRCLIHRLDRNDWKK